MTTGIPVGTTLFKVQLSLATTGPARQMLVTSEDGHWYEGKPNPGVLAAMKDRPKAFFYGHLSGETIVIDKEAPWQDW